MGALFVKVVVEYVLYLDTEIITAMDVIKRVILTVAARRCYVGETKSSH